MKKHFPPFDNQKKMKIMEDKVDRITSCDYQYHEASPFIGGNFVIEEVIP